MKKVAVHSPESMVSKEDKLILLLQPVTRGLYSFRFGELYVVISL